MFRDQYGDGSDISQGVLTGQRSPTTSASSR